MRTIILLVCINYQFALSFYPPNVFRRIQLTTLSANHEVDVAVIGGGIAGTTLSWLLQEKEKIKVALIDPNANKINGSWYPNYGEWRDEWHVLSKRLDLPELKSCTTTEWDYTDCFFGGSHGISEDERLKLNRAYVRVDRIKMQSLLRTRFSEAGGVAISSKVHAKRVASNLFDNGISHTHDGSNILLENGDSITCRIVIDATGPESRLIAHEEPFFARGSNKEVAIGYQIAYGFIAEVNHLGPYDGAAMTLFDYRTSHITTDSSQYSDANSRPTFMYTMPLKQLSNGHWRVFFEETSLVGRGSRRLSFQECRDRALQRLSYHNITIFGVEEEEFCYIPMGGELPDRQQRLIAFGGAANLVHPSTGYQACRMLAASTDVATVIAEGIRKQTSPDQIAITCYNTLWSSQNRLQRDFQVFGGDFLMAQNVASLRGFFSAFFALPMPVWSGFLAGYPGLPHNEFHNTWFARLSFALGLFVKMPLPVQLTIMAYAIKNTFEFGPNILLRSVTPAFLFGSGPADATVTSTSDNIGDMAAKDEARAMMSKFKPTVPEESLPPAYYSAESGLIPAPFDQP